MIYCIVFQWCLSNNSKPKYPIIEGKFYGLECTLLKNIVGYLKLTLFLLYLVIYKQIIAKSSPSSSFPADMCGKYMHFLLTLLPLCLKSKKWLSKGSKILNGLLTHRNIWIPTQTQKKHWDPLPQDHDTFKLLV